MSGSTTPTVGPLDERVDHVRGPADAPLIIEYGDYECPYSRLAFRAIERVERERDGGVRFAFRHFPLTDIPPHAPRPRRSTRRRGRITTEPLLADARAALPPPARTRRRPPPAVRPAART